MANSDIRLKDNEFRYVERILYDYAAHKTAAATLKAQLEDALQDLLPTAKGASMSSTPGIVATDEKCSEPEKWTIIRDQNSYIRHLRQRIEEIDRHHAIVEAALQALTDQEAMFCRLFYGNGKTIKACAATMHYGTRRLYNVRQAVVGKVARFAGLR